MKLLTKINLRKGVAIDAVYLTIVRIITSLIGLINIKVVSVYFSLDSYGLYSQATLIVSTVTSIIILGMTDAVNFFYNNNSDADDNCRNQYLSTIFTIELSLGILSGCVILVSSPLLNDYFNNEALSGIYIWIAFQPLFQCFFNMLQVLYISVGRIQSILYLNLLMSIIQLLIFISAALITESIITILALTFVCNVIQVLYLFYNLRKYDVILSLKGFKKELCRPILIFAIPMAAYILINSLLRDTDKWIVGYFGSTADLAIYTNCSRLLPFDLLIMSFYTILVPIITRQIKKNKNLAAEQFGKYLNLGLFTTSILIVPAIIFCRDFLLSLYSEQYLSGLVIFVIYILVDYCRFANISLIYSASGNTRALLRIVMMTFIANLAFSIILYKYIGIYGPAISTLLCMLTSCLFYLAGSSRILQQSVFKMIHLPQNILIIVEALTISFLIKLFADQYMIEWYPITRFLVCYGLIVLAIYYLNHKPIMKLVADINQYK